MKKEISYVEDVAKAISKSLKINTNEDLFGKPSWFLHSGNLALDYILSGKVDGTGGYPGGRVVEIFGPPSTGKSLLLALAAANLQKSYNGLAVIQDVEKRWDTEFAYFHGVSPDEILPMTIDVVEDFGVKTVKLLDHLISMGDKAPKCVILTDSIAALSTLKEVEDMGTKADQGRKAQRLKAAMRILPGKIYEAGAILIVTNHTTANVGAGLYGPKLITSSGSAFPFQASTRIELFTTKQIKLPDKDRPIGIIMRAKCTKNSVTIPFGEAEITMTWAKGVDKVSGLLDIAIDLGIIKKDGNRLVAPSGEKFYSKDFRLILMQNPEILTDPVWSSPYFKIGLDTEDIVYEEPAE